MRKIVSYIVLLALLITCQFTLSSCAYTVWYPTEGIWYCDELQMQLDFKTGADSFFVIDDTKIPCAAENDRGSKFLGVMCQSFNCKYCHLGTWVLSAERVDLTETQLVVKSTEGVYYIFERIQ